ncbi:hypothetical protein DUNSADRAFT_9188, partial [Dunaliella salina]
MISLMRTLQCAFWPKHILVVNSVLCCTGVGCAHAVAPPAMRFSAQTHPFGKLCILLPRWWMCSFCAPPQHTSQPRRGCLVVVDVLTLLRPPQRSTRPKRILIVLRGLPGSGKSFLAKKIRDVEVEEGGEPPRVHAIDDYFVAEVEKEVDDPTAKTGKGRKKKVYEMEYQYDPDMEAAYQKSLVRALTRTMDEGRYTFVVMDAPNTRLDEFRDVLAAAQ